MSKDRCMGCKEFFSTDWPPETDGTKSLSGSSSKDGYWYVCPHCKGKNFVIWDGEDKIIIDRFQKE